MKINVVQLLLTIAVLVVTVSLIEGVVLSLRKAGSYNWRTTGVSLLDLVVRNLLRYALPASLILPVAQWLWHRRPCGCQNLDCGAAQGGHACAQDG